MSLEALRKRLRHAPFAEQLRTWCEDATDASAGALYLKHAVGSLPAFLLYEAADARPAPLLCIQDDDEAAAYLHADLEAVGGEDAGILRFPSSARAPYDREALTDAAPRIERAEVLRKLTEGHARLVVTSVDALYEKVPPPESVTQDTLLLTVGEEIAPGDLVAQLQDQGFDRVEFVDEPGDVALRGGIVDVFPFAGTYPLRFEFFGDEIDSIREFDVRTQRSVSRQQEARIVPDVEARTDQAGTPHGSLFDYLPEGALVAAFNEQGLVEHADALYATAEDAYAAHAEEDGEAAPPHERYLTGQELSDALLLRPRLLFGAFAQNATETLDCGSRPQPSFNADLHRLRQHLVEQEQEQVTTTILCDSRGQRRRLKDLLFDTLPEELRQEDAEAQSLAALPAPSEEDLTLTVASLHEGFRVPDLHLAVYTDHQIFNRYHRPTAGKKRSVHGGLSLRQVQDMKPGDFVVHVDYGIGRFAGLALIEVRGREQEAVKLFFKGDDVLYVNTNALHKLHKYTSKEGHQPGLTKLGSGVWEKKKSRTKKRVKEMARDLIKLYAERKEAKGFAFSEDSVWQRELEVGFRYEDTPDQSSAAEAVKADMQLPVPMDRLVCGDVGFGKTEVAVRAAFKAVQDGKQVAILVPTTILARQHERTFGKRLGDYPVRVEQLSRFITKKQQTDILAGLKEGTVDIVVGTHRLVGKDVEFKDLGLLIIDEEQRFGVKVKEKLRKFRVNVDTLTLTATPIPRTLQFSLLGARDLSVIATPPPNRQPIITEIHTWDAELIADAIRYELDRGGQVFFIHNRVRTIDQVSEMLRGMVPGVRIGVAHGQMRSTQLEKAMGQFADGEFQVLVSTSLIENGLDISNANTIIIDRADHFGLSELHQIRGRVGRSDRKAFCYLLVPSIHGLTKEAKQRLQAIEEFSDLGSGLQIAMRDLDIRGAGSLLGREQSGFIEDIGFETYHQILDEAVSELRREEFSHVFGEDVEPPAAEPQVDADADTAIPVSYVQSNVERLNMYRRVSGAESKDDLKTLREEFKDRFGPVPKSVENLLVTAELGLLARRLRLRKVLFKNERLFLYPPSQEQDPYFYANVFHPFLARLNDLRRRYVLKDEQGKKLRAIIQTVADLKAAREVLLKLQIVPQAKQRVESGVSRETEAA